MENNFVMWAMETLRHYTDPLVAAANFTAATFLLVLAGVSIHTLMTKTFNKDSALPMMLVGVAVESASWAVHRSFYGSWRVLREYGYVEWDRWLIDNSYLSLIPHIGVLTGLALILGPVWTMLRGGSNKDYRDYIIPAVLMVGVYWFLFFKIYTPRPVSEAAVGEYSQMERKISLPLPKAIVDPPKPKTPVRNPYRFSN